MRLLSWVRPQWIIGDRGEAVSERAGNWLGSAKRDRPFFLWLHYLDPHPPYSRAGATRHKSLRGDMSFQPIGDGHEPVTLTSPDVARLRSGEIRLNDAEKEAVRELYRVEVASVDAAVGEVLEALDANGLHQDTLVICAADHGEEFWEHGGVEHGHTVYDELVHVPLLMRWPGHLPAGAREPRTARITDVAPTIMQLVGLPVPAGLDGEALLPLGRGDAAPGRVAVTENMLFAEERIGIRVGNHEYIRWANGKEELYDLARDPREQRDLAGSESSLGPLRQIAAALDRQVTAPPGATEANIDPGAANAMRALGYLH